MKFSIASVLIAGAAVAQGSLLAERSSSLCSYGTAALQEQLSFVYPLFTACKTALNGKYTNPWGNKICVAAAVVGSPGLIRDALSCSYSSMGDLDTLPYLDYSVYAAIVGSCAYSSTACKITKQNLIDLVYGAISAESSAVWPSSSDALTDTYITPIFTWTATGSKIPYTNFNDWLHYAPDDESDC
ncbi:unnamed protein product [Peniophora sp. CBMAI 1063]|nr:unnamed protein product [Peniophora sp. CBMAI 1063]